MVIGASLLCGLVLIELALAIVGLLLFINWYRRDG